MTVHREAAVGFERAAAVYERSRPGYPRRTVVWLTDQLDLGPGRIVVDLAAGTGKLTRALGAAGPSVIAIEPVVAMLATLSASAGERVAPVAATADALPLAARSVDAFTVAQAFHWFAGDVALAEMMRVLRPGGRIALVWNRRPLDDPLQAAVEGVIGAYRTDTPSYATGAWRAVIDQSPLVGVHATHAVDYATTTSGDGLVDRVLSTSFIAALPDGERTDVAARIRAAATQFGPAAVLRYRCEAYVLTPR